MCSSHTSFFGGLVTFCREMLQPARAKDAKKSQGSGEESEHSGDGCILKKDLWYLKLSCCHMYPERLLKICKVAQKTEKDVSVRNHQSLARV